jgi:uncharacterized membrane protein
MAQIVLCNAAICTYTYMRLETATKLDTLKPGFSTPRAVMRWILAIFFVAAGVAHLAAPEELLKITPEWVPFAPQVIFVTGWCEFAGAAALVTRPLRHWAGIALAAYAVCVWPANFKHALDGIDIPHITSSWWYHAPRLALQPVIVWWALFCAGVIDWPWRGGADRASRL